MIPPQGEGDAGAGAGLSFCLSGGGYSGALFQMGALTALADATGLGVTRAPMVVGTSSGAVVAALLGLGIHPADALRRRRGESDPPVRFRPSDLSRFPWADHASGLVRGVRAAAGAVFRRGDPGPREALIAELPPGIYTNRGVERLILDAARACGVEPRFESLQSPTRMVATALDTGGRVVFGAGHRTLDLARAVRASTAIPTYFEPVNAGGTDCIDGQIVDPLNIDLAVTSDTRAVLALDALCPYRPTAAMPRVRRFGAGAVMDQSARISASIKTANALERFRRDHPDLPMAVIGPAPEEVSTLFHTGYRLEGGDTAWKQGYLVMRRALSAPSAPLAGVLSAAGAEVDASGLAEGASRWGVASRSSGDSR